MVGERRDETGLPASLENRRAERKHHNLTLFSLKPLTRDFLSSPNLQKGLKSGARVNTRIFHACQLSGKFMVYLRTEHMQPHGCPSRESTLRTTNTGINKSTLA